MDEIWKNIKGYEGLYEVSNCGRVRNCRTGLVLKPRKDRKCYLQVKLWKDGVHKACLVHRLVAQAFPDLVGWTEDAKGRPLEELEINHKDQNKENNHIDNLEWCDSPYNNRYSKSKKVYMYTLDNKLCGLWPSTMECGRNGLKQSNIVRCCNGKLKKHKGYRWSYDAPIPPKALPYFEALPRS